MTTSYLDNHFTVGTRVQLTTVRKLKSIVIVLYDVEAELQEVRKLEADCDNVITCA